MTTAVPDPGLTWSLRDRHLDDIAVVTDGLPELGAGGRGVRVCVVDSGVERDHPAVGRVNSSWVVLKDDTGIRVDPTDTGDACGHGTACAGIVRRVAPHCEIGRAHV